MTSEEEVLHSMSSSEEDEDTVSLASSVAELSQGKVMCLPAKPITTVVWPDVMQKSTSTCVLCKRVPWI